MITDWLYEMIILIFPQYVNSFIAGAVFLDLMV